MRSLPRDPVLSRFLYKQILLRSLLNSLAQDEITESACDNTRALVALPMHEMLLRAQVSGAGQAGVEPAWLRVWPGLGDHVHPHGE